MSVQISVLPGFLLLLFVSHFKYIIIILINILVS